MKKLLLQKMKGRKEGSMSKNEAMVAEFFAPTQQSYTRMSEN